MLRLKKVIFALVSLLALTLTVDRFTSDAQTKKGGGGAKPPAQSTLKRKVVAQPLPVRQGVDYTTFNHATHSPDCMSCHDQHRFDQRAVQFPKHAACEDCHPIPVYTLGTRFGFCYICHEKDAKTVLSTFPELKEEQFGVKFPHSVHVGLDAKDFNLGNIAITDTRTDEDRKIQEVSKTSGCIECHEKDGKDKKEENFTNPGHPECARCHGVAPKMVPPLMIDCLGCHKPFLAPKKAVSNIVASFRHDKDHEKDTRPDAKKGALLDCKFCHKVTATTKRLQDVTAPFLSNCTVCHNDGKKATAHALKSSESVNLAIDPAPAKK
jgi:cytochrome c553